MTMPPKSLPPGVKLHRTFEGHTGTVNGLALDPSGQILASAGNDMTIKLWDTRTGDLLRSLVGHQQSVWSVAFHPDGRSLASGSADGTVRLWETSSGNELYELKGPKRTDYARHVSQRVWSIAYDPDGQWLVSGHENAVVLWNTNTGDPLRTYETQESSEQASDRYAFQEGTRDVVFDPTAQMVVSGHGRTIQVWDRAVGNLIYAAERHSAAVKSVAIHPSGSTLVSGSLDRTIMVWELSTGKLLRTLEGHTGSADAVAFSPNGQLLASKSRDGTVRLWRCDTWDTVAVIPVATHSAFLQSLAFHPTARQLFTSATTIDQADVGISRLIYCLELDLDQLLSEAPVTKSTRRAVHHTTAKIVLVGDHSVGKSGLAWRLAHGEFKEQSSTHGQQFWVLPQLGKLREDGTECEAILWDLAGQPDYRLIHALFLDDVDLALVLFDSSHLSDPLHGVEFWLKHLNSLERGNQAAGSSEVSKGPPCFIILIGAQADRGTPTLTFDELETFCRQRGVSGYISTSAKTGAGIEALIQRMKDVIPWDDKPATVTTVTFKRIKDFVLKLKENLDGQELVIVTPQELRQRLERQDPDWKFSDEEVVTAVGHLENYGYAKRLRTSKGELRVLLVPELLNNLAASFVLEARKNEKGLGSLEEKRVLAGEYPFPELEKLPKGERDILLDSAALLFLKHNICFRETDPLNVRSYLVFPQLINLKKPTSEEEQTEDGMVYTVSGAIENVYASLVVLLGYTQTFTRTNQWHNHARYEVGEQFICGFRQELEREGELEFILYFGGNVPSGVRTLFQGLFESLLARKNLTVTRYEPVRCGQCHQPLDRSVARSKLREGKTFTFCNDCGYKLMLPEAHEPIPLTEKQKAEVEAERHVADQRSKFEQSVYRLHTYVKDQGMKVPVCFISYAWGEKEQERWVERNLAYDLQKAGINVLLDRWENARVGASIPRFIERIENADRIIVVGTPLYRRKYDNKDTTTGYVVAAEADLIASRLLGTEIEKETVLPALLVGESKTSLPPLLHHRVYADFRDETDYFITAFDLILDLYGISHGQPAVTDLRESLGN